MTRLFYDAGCGLCLGAVRFTLRHDCSGSIRYAPLGGATFAQLIAPGVPFELPDSLLVRTAAGELLTRSQAVIHLLRRMGPVWRFSGCLLALLPSWLCDYAYDLMARHRPRSGVCQGPDVNEDKRFEP